MNMAQHLHFHLLYDGPALRQKWSATRMLLPALLATIDLITRTNALLNGRQATISIDVRGLPKPGAYSVMLRLSRSGWQRALALNNHPAGADLDAMIGLLGIGRRMDIGVAQAMAWLAGRSVCRITPVTEGIMRLHVQTEHLDIGETVLRLLQDYDVRYALQGVIAEPLSLEGIATVMVINQADGHTVLAVDRHHATSFQAQQHLTVG